MTPIKGYKGFDKDMKCRGFQYEVGQTYETSESVLCEKGFHFCKQPLDVLEHYGFVSKNAELNVFAEVEALDDVIDAEDGKKSVTKKLRIVKVLSVTDLVNAQIEYIKEHDDPDSAQTSIGSGYRSVATNTGNYSAATNTGDYSAATNTGNFSAATNTGYCSAATNTGNCSAATNTGYCSAATNTGYRSAATNTGKCSVATNTGNCSAAMNTGYRSAATNSGKVGVAIVTGYQSKAKASLGGAICVCERGNWNGDTYPLLAIKAAIIDGEKLKPDTFYTLKDGEFVEVKE